MMDQFKFLALVYLIMYWIFYNSYYEWHTDSNKKKQPYFIYFSQQEPVKDLNLPESYEFDYEGANGEIDEKWTGHRLLTMAGIFDKWTPPDVSTESSSLNVLILLLVKKENKILIPYKLFCLSKNLVFRLSCKSNMCFNMFVFGVSLC